MLALDASMLVASRRQLRRRPSPMPAARAPIAASTRSPPPDAGRRAPCGGRAAAAEPGAACRRRPSSRAVTAGLVAPEAAAAAASSVGTLVRTLAEHHVARGLSRRPDAGGHRARGNAPDAEGWLDENLPPLVERLVRAEIERVVGRATS